MTDKLEWLNKHLVLIEYRTLSDAEKLGGYSCPPIVKHNYPNENSVEGLLHSLSDANKFREGCDLLSAVLHKRVLVWWGYSCILNLLQELREKNVEKVDIAEIGKQREFNVPEWAKPVEEEPIDPELLADLEKKVDQALNQINQTIESVPPEVVQLFYATLDKYEGAIKEETGYTLREQIKQCVEDYNPAASNEDDSVSPIDKAVKELEEKLEKKRQEIVEQIKDVFPEEPPHYRENLRDSALDAVWLWINSPNEVNTQHCLDAGNACTEHPAGILALTAFWSFGNLTPTQERVTQTPPGLAAKGLSALLLQCALHDGGNKSFKERYRKYFEIGFKIACGQDSWTSETIEKESPHRRILAKTTKADDGEGRFRVQPDRGLFGKENS